MVVDEGKFVGPIGVVKGERSKKERRRNEVEADRGGGSMFLLYLPTHWPLFVGTSLW